jgi:hypothetical protein
VAAAGEPRALPRLASEDIAVQNPELTFAIIGEMEQVETIASGRGVKIRAVLNKVHGRGRWRKRKGVATVRLPSGALRRVELLWYEAHGVSRRDFKVKTYLDEQ